jgi:glucokinase
LINNDRRKEKSLLMKLAGGNQHNITTETLYNAAKMGDELSLEIVDKIGKLNAIGIANVINNFNPSLITIGGSIALKNPKLMLKPIKKYVKDYAFNRIPKIMLTPLGENAVICGAIAMVFYYFKS